MHFYQDLRYYKNVKKSLTLGIIILIAFLLNLFPKSPFISTAFAVTCAPPIPVISVLPKSGNEKTNYEITLGWADMPDKDFEKYVVDYITVKMVLVPRGEKSPTGYSPPELILTHVKKENKTYSFSGLFDLLPRKEPYIVDIHLYGEFAYSGLCNLEATPQSITVTVEEPKPGEDIGLKAGELCDPERQGLDKRSTCEEGTSCKTQIKIEGGDIKTICVADTVTYKEDPNPEAICSKLKKVGGKETCEQINSAIGLIDTEPQAFVRRIFSLVLGIAGGVALILIMYSGYKMMLSQGNPEKVQDARQQLTSAIIGLLFIIFSFVILQIIGVDLLKIPGFKK